MTNATFLTDQIARAERAATEIRAMEARGDYGGRLTQVLRDFEEATGAYRGGQFTYRTAPTGWTTDREAAIDSWTR